MRTRVLSTLAAAALMTVGLPGIASATCTDVIEEFGCLENVVCPAVTAVVKQADCIE